MTASARVPQISHSAFGTAFAVLLRGSRRARGLALFTVFPRSGIVLPGTLHSTDVADPALDFLAPAMCWYGWTATAAIGALAAGLHRRGLAASSWARRFWSGWCVASSPLRDDRVRLPDPAMVSTITTDFDRNPALTGRS